MSTRADPTLIGGFVVGAVASNAIAEDSELYYRVSNTLDELAAAARSIRGLAD